MRREIVAAAVMVVITIIPARSVAQSVEGATSMRTEVVVNASSSEMTVVAVPVPASFAPGTRLTFTVTPVVEGAVLGRLSGSVVATRGREVIVLAVRAPRHAPAGRHVVASVRFRSASDVSDTPFAVANHT